jgi:hypothetical protein
MADGFALIEIRNDHQIEGARNSVSSVHHKRLNSDTIFRLSCGFKTEDIIRWPDKPIDGVANQSDKLIP